MNLIESKIEEEDFFIDDKAINIIPFQDHLFKEHIDNDECNDNFFMCLTMHDIYGEEGLIKWMWLKKISEKDVFFMADLEIDKKKKTIHLPISIKHTTIQDP